jgi:transposase
LIAGIDTHKDTLAVAVIDQAGRQLAHRELPNTRPGFADLTALLDQHRVNRVGIEGSGAYGRAVAVHLALDHSPDGGDDLRIVEVPTLMTSRERSAKPGQGKTDPIDALAIARITARETTLPPVRLTVGPAADMRALLDYRDELIAERTALANRVHAELAGLLPGYQHQIGTLTTRTRVRAALALLEELHSVRADLARRRLERILAIDTEAKQLKTLTADLVDTSGTTLTDEYGIGPLVAARFLAEVVDVRRYPTRDTFAAANGTAPIPASSGRTVRHRFNPGGNRQLNRALYTIAITQIRADTEGRRYYDRKRAEGKTRREALRCLKRRLSDVVYRYMRDDAARTHDTAPLPVVSAVGPALKPVGSHIAVDAEDAKEARLTA